MDSNWKVRIRESLGLMTYGIFIYREVGGKLEISRGNLIETVEEGSAPEPSLELYPQQLQAFANALNEMGINPQKEYIEGKLEATTSHLADLRTLLKLK